MAKLVYIDACLREKESRTLRIATPIVDALSEKYDIREYHLGRMEMDRIDPDFIRSRNNGIVPEWALAAAKDIAEADRIVIAAPFWDMSFPSSLKVFFEHTSLFGVTFADNGTECYGLCRNPKVLYITTRGMNIPTGDSREQATPYIKALSVLWGLGPLTVIDAFNMDYSSASEIEQKIQAAVNKGLEIARDF